MQPKQLRFILSLMNAFIVMHYASFGFFYKIMIDCNDIVNCAVNFNCFDGRKPELSLNLDNFLFIKFKRPKR